MKKVFPILCAVLLLTLLIASGCAQPAPAPAPKPTAAPAPAAKPAATPTTAPAPQAPAKVYKWKLHTFMPSGETIYKDIVRLAELIKTNTKGQVEITTFTAGALVPAAEIFKSAANDVIQMGYALPGYHSGFIPAAAVADGLPMTFQNIKDVQELFYKGGIGDTLRTEYAKNGVYLLSMYAPSPTTLISKKELRKPEDFQGTKLRGFGVWSKYLGMLGASAVDMPAKDVYMGITTGVVDGSVSGITALYENKLYEVCKFLIWPPLVGAGLHDIFIGTKAWEPLPADIKETISKTAIDWGYETAEKNYVYALECKDLLAKQGVKMVEVDKDWLMSKAKVLVDEVGAKDAASTKIANIIKDYWKRVGAIK